MLKSCCTSVFSKQLNVIVENSLLQLHRRSLSALHANKKKVNIGHKLENRKLFRTSTATMKTQQDGEGMDKALLNFTEFERKEEKNKETFMRTVYQYEQTFVNTRGHVDFIRAALNNMKEYGVHRDLEVYKALVNILPKGPYVVENWLMVDMMYHPRQQFVILDLLDNMEFYGVIPDIEFGQILKSIFGAQSHPCKRYCRMMYWTSKFKNLSPWPLPRSMPSDSLWVAKKAIERITSTDLQTEVSVLQSEDIPESLDKTWIVSGQSPTQERLLRNHNPDTPVVVEGGDVVWLRDKCVNYFVLKADCEPFPVDPPEDKSDVSQLDSMYFNPKYTEKRVSTRSVHEQDDGIIYAVCATGTSTKDSLLSWVRLLQKRGNTILGEVPVLFRFRSGESLPVPFTEALTTQEHQKS